MNNLQVINLIRGMAGSTFFRVVFRKRSTGERREMVCRLGVGRGVSGRGMSYDPVEKGLLTVWSVRDEGFRSIPIDGILSIRIRGQEAVLGAA